MTDPYITILALLHFKIKCICYYYTKLYTEWNKKRKKEKGKTNTQNKYILPGPVTKTVRKSSRLKEIISTEWTKQKETYNTITNSDKHSPIPVITQS